MKSCAFFGHRNLYVEPYRDKLLQIVINLIENECVTQFYSGYRGNFDVYCSQLIFELKRNYPQIRNTMVLSYLPDNQNKRGCFDDCSYNRADCGRGDLPQCFDDSVYLLEKSVPKRFAIAETNKCLVDVVDVVVAGVIRHSGGAYSACKYAFTRKKSIITVIDGWKID